MSNYAWLIQRDFVDDGMAENHIGPPEVDATFAQIADRGIGFRLLTDDGHVAYEGTYHGPSDVTRFRPLHDFGAVFADCTTIEYLNAAGQWEPLQ